MSEKLLTGKNIIVTGTARGMGHAMVSCFASYGANVFAHARTDTKEHRDFCLDTEKEYGTKAIPVYFDLTDHEAMKEAVKEIRSFGLPVNGLVNNAGIGNNFLFQMTKEDELRRIFETNFFSPYLFTQYIVKLMQRSGSGSIVNISSTSGLDGNSGKSSYGSSKAALACMTKCIAEELGPSGIRANAICPGVIETEMAEGLPDYIIEINKNAADLKKLGQPSDIAEIAAFLLSDMSSYVTGQIIRADGGIGTWEKRL